MQPSTRWWSSSSSSHNGHKGDVGTPRLARFTRNGRAFTNNFHINTFTFGQAFAFQIALQRSRFWFGPVLSPCVATSVWYADFTVKLPSLVNGHLNLSSLWCRGMVIWRTSSTSIGSTARRTASSSQAREVVSIHEATVTSA